MLRICGITYVRTTNYGSCFQAYALQKAIDGITVGNGENCEHKYVALWRCADHFTNCESNWKFYQMVLRRFKAFQEGRIQYTECKSISELPAFNEYYDAFVCGSDVIWNPRFNHKLGLYYLDFANKYKFSYAASFGVSDIEDSFLKASGQWIAELSEISVREQSSVEVVKKYSGRDARVIADPVILLTREDWDRIAGKRKSKKSYIFAYTTHYSSEFEQFLQKLSKTTGLRVVRATWHINKRDALRQGIMIAQPPEKWLQQLRDAEYVVTNSFHATVFASIFHKKFFMVVHGEMKKGRNIRMYDFLNSVGLLDRMYLTVPESIDLSDIDFSQSDRIIGTMRDDGLGYLRENLEAAYEAKMKKQNEAE